MDYQEFIDNFTQIACVISVDLRTSDETEKFKTVAANEAYKLSVMDDPSKFVSNVPYTNYITRDKNFESMCLACVTSGKSIHAYVDAALYNAWMDINMQPLRSNDEGIGYCQFSYSMSPKAETEKLADISNETAVHVLKTCIKLRETDDFEEAIDSVIKDVRNMCKAKRCSIMLTDFNKRTCQVLSEAYSEDDKERPFKDYLEDGSFFNIVETWPNIIAGSNCCIIRNESEMAEMAKIAPRWVDSLKTANVKTLVIFPLRTENETIGYIWAGNFDPERTQIIKETLEVTTFILTAEIANHQMVKKMEIMSATDLLTGVYNRNAMNNRILESDTGTVPIKGPFGVFFVDVNGLKTTNDSLGHVAGDNLLKDVAYTLKEIFADYEVYRVGGDEFLVILTEISEERFNELEMVLCSQSERPNRAHYAVGSCYSDEAEDNIRKAMQLADAKMYVNKDAYYRNHPEFSWDRRGSRR